MFKILDWKIKFPKNEKKVFNFVSFSKKFKKLKNEYLVHSLQKRNIFFEMLNKNGEKMILVWSKKELKKVQCWKWQKMCWKKRGKLWKKKKHWIKIIEIVWLDKKICKKKKLD